MEFMKPKQVLWDGINVNILFYFVKPFPYPTFLVHTSCQTSHFSEHIQSDNLEPDHIQQNWLQLLDQGQDQFSSLLFI